jgi:hypothetical protein
VFVFTRCAYFTWEPSGGFHGTHVMWRHVRPKLVWLLSCPYLGAASCFGRVLLAIPSVLIWLLSCRLLPQAEYRVISRNGCHLGRGVGGAGWRLGWRWAGGQCARRWFLLNPQTWCSLFLPPFIPSLPPSPHSLSPCLISSRFLLLSFHIFQLFPLPLFLLFHVCTSSNEENFCMKLPT